MGYHGRMTISPTDAERIEALLKELITTHTLNRQEFLTVQAASQSPRRQEIISMIRDHRQVSFDFLARNFRGVKVRTLHYDLQQLVKAGFIRKLGSTRGVLYVSAM